MLRIVFAALISLFLATRITCAAIDVNLHVDAGDVRALMPDFSIGLHTSVYANQFDESELADSGVRMLRFPGGNYASIYHWTSHTATGGCLPFRECCRPVDGCKGLAEEDCWTSQQRHPAQDVQKQYLYIRTVIGYHPSRWALLGNSPVPALTVARVALHPRRTAFTLREVRSPHSVLHVRAEREQWEILEAQTG